MGLRNSSVLCLALFLALSSSIQGMDIVKSLSKNPDLAKFSKYLVETKLADQINSMKAATVFVVDDAALAPLEGKSLDVIKTVLGSQIIADFYDQRKLIYAQGGHDLVPTLTGSGMYIGLIGEGEEAFSTGANSNKYDAKLVQQVALEEGVLSVQQITELLDVSAARAAPSVAKSVTAASMGVGGGAPAPAPSSGSRVGVMGLVGGAVMALASLFISL